MPKGQIYVHVLLRVTSDSLALNAGVSNFSELKYYKQVQATAVPVNASDPRLKLWKKSPSNPIISQPPPDGTLAQFRDPVSAWKQVHQLFYFTESSLASLTIAERSKSCTGDQIHQCSE